MDHIGRIADRMREADRQECAAAGRGPYRALADCYTFAAAAWTGLVDDDPICMFGVSPKDILAGIGSPWLLGTPEIEKNAIAFLRMNKRYVRMMLELFPHLVNYVDVRNTASIRWLKWLGFKLESAPVPFGVWGLPFFRFEMRLR